STRPEFRPRGSETAQAACLMFRLLIVVAAASTLLAADGRLIEAVKRRDPNAVKSLLGQKVDVNAALPDGGTALAWAVQHDDREMAAMLLSAGANVNAANEYGETPLTLACLNGD